MFLAFFAIQIVSKSCKEKPCGWIATHPQLNRHLGNLSYKVLLFPPHTGSITTSVSGQRATLSSSDLFQRIVRANSCKGLQEPAQFLK
jgi:hypothetical protein